MIRTLLFVLLGLVLTACAPGPVRQGPPPQGEATSAPDESVDAPASATAALLDQSRRQSASGQYPQAAASVERALRIEPGNPWLWLELAQIHLASGNIRQAEANARKALSLSGTDRTAEQRARRLLDRLAGP